MSNRPPLNWSSVLRDLKADHAARQSVREDRLRVAQGLRGGAALALSAWRGRSGRRYVVGVHPIASFDPAEDVGAVVLFIARDLVGVATTLFGGFNLTESEAAAQADRAADLGATEVHVHRLAHPVERAAVIADLGVKMVEVA